MARRAGQIVGHIQLIPAGFDWEIKSLAVVEEQRSQGIGTALVRAALDLTFSATAVRVVVATASADIENMRFYQRIGFRMDHVERDAFTIDQGYPVLEVDGIPVRDRIWYSVAVSDPL